MKPFFLVSLFFASFFACKQADSKTAATETPAAILSESPAGTDTASVMAPDVQETGDGLSKQEIDGSKPQSSPTTGIVPAGDRAAVPNTHGKAPADQPVRAVPAEPKFCDPNYTKIASPKSNHHLLYVTGFNPGEFKCWVELEEKGHAVCDSTPCVIYFVDKPSVRANPASEHYMTPEDLRSACIGRYEYNGKYWEIQGAAKWKREGKGYAYYNTNNQLGG